jgi:cytidylate kinase
VYQSILTVRCLCMKQDDPCRWEKLHKMEHHNSLRKELTDLWNRNEVNTVRFLRDVYKVDFDDMTIHSVIGYADINAFEIRSEGVE